MESSDSKYLPLYFEDLKNIWWQSIIELFLQKSTWTQSWLWYSLAFSFWSHPVDLSCPEADIAETHTDKDITIIKTTEHTNKTNSTREPDILMVSCYLYFDQYQIQDHRNHSYQDQFCFVLHPLNTIMKNYEKVQ